MVALEWTRCLARHRLTLPGPNPLPPPKPGAQPPKVGGLGGPPSPAPFLLVQLRLSPLADPTENHGRGKARTGLVTKSAAKGEDVAT